MLPQFTFEDALFDQKVRALMKAEGRLYATYPDLEVAFWDIASELRAPLERVGKLDEARDWVVENIVPALAVAIRKRGFRVEPA